MKKLPARAFAIVVTVCGMLVAVAANAQWSAEPGATVRNAFGPQVGNNANQCRGACGAGCPDSCAATESYECIESPRLRRVVGYDCGTHQGCRIHDDCLDDCLQSSAQGGSCQSQCDGEVMQRFGLESSASWLTGGGPYDGRIQFEYTRDAPGALEPTFRCPSGANRQCSGPIGCVAPDGTRVDPVFDSYPAAGADTMRVSDFRSGPSCGTGVCEHSTNIQVNGTDSCAGGKCTRFGMEFDYHNADPAVPLECSTSTSGGDGDFVGDLLKQGADAMSTRGGSGSPDGQSEDGMAELLGLFQQVLASADSPEDVNISMAPLGEDGKPIESQRVGSGSGDNPPTIPHSVDLPASNGHLFVPMYQLTDDSNSGNTKERRVRCTHKGVPVLETIFRLHFS